MLFSVNGVTYAAPANPNPCNGKPAYPEICVEWQVSEGRSTIVWNQQNEGDSLQQLGITINPDVYVVPVHHGCVLNVQTKYGLGCLIANFHTLGFTPSAHYHGPALFFPVVTYGTPAMIYDRRAEFNRVMEEIKRKYKTIEGEIDIFKSVVDLENNQTLTIGKVNKGKVRMNRVSKGNCDNFIDVTPSSGVLLPETEIKVKTKDRFPRKTTCTLQLFWSPTNE